MKGRLKHGDQIILLKDLGQLVRSVKKRIDQSFTYDDVCLSFGFKNAFSNNIFASGNSIQFKKTTATITASVGQKIFLPNQWFVLAAYAVELVQEIIKYRTITEHVLEMHYSDFIDSNDNIVKKK